MDTFLFLPTASSFNLYIHTVSVVEYETSFLIILRISCRHTYFVCRCVQLIVIGDGNVTNKHIDRISFIFMILVKILIVHIEFNRYNINLSK